VKKKSLKAVPPELLITFFFDPVLQRSAAPGFDFFQADFRPRIFLTPLFLSPVWQMWLVLSVMGPPKSPPLNSGSKASPLFISFFPRDGREGYAAGGSPYSPSDPL